MSPSPASKSKSLKIGEIYEGEFLPEGEGPILEYTHDRLNLVLQLGELSEGEVTSFQESTFQLALFTSDEIVFVVLDIPGVIDWSDAPYSIATFPQELWPADSTNGSGPQLTLTAVLVEAKDRTILGVREVKLSEEFSAELLSCVALQKKSLITAEECLSRIKNIQNKYPPDRMAEKAAAREEVKGK
ncbi:MAG: hypothetical protein H7222_17575 [Methylotenera sp.]|nr:hypothetical protein [Oligoflexia bacterium]